MTNSCEFVMRRSTYLNEKKNPVVCIYSFTYLLQYHCRYKISELIEFLTGPPKQNGKLVN